MLHPWDKLCHCNQYGQIFFSAISASLIQVFLSLNLSLKLTFLLLDGQAGLTKADEEYLPKVNLMDINTCVCTCTLYLTY